MSGILQLVNTFPSGGFAVKNSLRFRSSASAYLSRTFGTPTSQQLMTFSFWVKRGLLAKNNMIWNNFVSGSSYGQILFGSSDSIEIYSRSGSATTQINLISTQVFRDPSAWYHIVVAVDTTQATASNRVKLYVNGSQVTSFSTATYPSQNDNINFEISGRSTAIGVRADLGDSTQNLDGYMAEINFIDGQALDPSSFGAFDATSGVWQATRYSGTYGTNGFYLKFSDTTSTTTLCYDYSGNSNNWTPNNISLTAGSTYDSMLDSPTNYDNGGNGVGNYAVLNPLNVNGSTLSEANLKASYIVSTNANSQARGSFAVASGKWYWEVLLSNVVSGCLIGIVKSNSAYNVGFNTANSWLYYSANGAKWNGSSSAYAASSTTGDIIGVAFDSDNGTLTFYKNGSSLGQAFSGLTGISLSPVAYDDAGNNTTVLAFNFGQRPFAYTPPTGYKALNTQNLPAPSIVNGASYMAATTYTGTGASLSVSGAAFQPDLVWIKSRSAATDHALYDVIRGVQDRLESNTTDAEVTSDNGLTAFNSNGFTVNTLAQVNTNAATYIGWQWKAGGTAVTNTAGSITSSVSANTTAGFSVVTYTGTAGGTVGHGLGIAPSMIICKTRQFTASWVIYHVTTGNNYALEFNTSAAIFISNYWGSTNPTSSVFGIAPLPSYANNSGDLVAYCFAAIPGYSAFGSYTGNGSADGPFVFLGFRPRWLLVKRSSTGGNYWILIDTSRGTYNVNAPELYPNASDAETAGSKYDLLSNGFKVRDSAAAVNASGDTYIYAAFAENPLKYSLAR